MASLVSDEPLSAGRPSPAGNSGDPPSTASSTLKRAALACANCRKCKARCIVSNNPDSCEECCKRNKECIWVQSNRGKWSRPAKRGKLRETQRFTVSPASHVDFRDDRANPSVSLLPAKANSPPARASLTYEHRGAGNGAETETRADENTVEHVHNPGHFRVDGALFPLGVLAEASRQIDSNANQVESNTQSEMENSSSSLWNSSSQAIGVANNKYFHDDIREHLLPKGNVQARASILADQIITIAQAEQLFKIFFKRLNPQLGLLDERTCSPQSCRQRSVFLFTAICAVAARFSKNDLLYHVLLQHARKAGLDAMLTSKSTATVQGFIIIATWSQQSVSYEACNAYFYAGIAIRIGVEIGLHRKTVLRYPDNMDPSIKQVYTREVLERERTWLCVFVMDRSMSAMTGKPPQAPETYLIRDVDKWWRQPECLLSDVFVSALTQLLRLLYRCIDVIYSRDDIASSVSTGHNYQVVVKDLQWRLDEWGQTWTQNLNKFHCEHGEAGPLDLYISNLQFFRAFYNLVPLSFGLQHYTVDSFDRVDQISFVAQCYQCARSTLEVATYQLKHTENFKAIPDVAIVAVGYAACFLLKLIGPKFPHLFNDSSVIELIKTTATLLEEASEDERHIHNLYSLFLRKHLSLRQPRSSPLSADTSGHNTQDVNAVTDPCSIHVNTELDSSSAATSGQITQEPRQLPSTQIGNIVADQYSTEVNTDLDDSFTATSGQITQEPNQLPSTQIGNTVTDLYSTDVNIDLDGSLNFISMSGVDVFRPADDLDSGWMDSVLGLQNRRNDPFWSLLQVAPPASDDFDF
ncbi:fungal-specific transcription factor domain-containing protein [Exophiala viscosa]|uniref:Fungal-specific transcription factor domain-containing protein n=1 Tax=Exophiala viscosa TaxID=2486360 RepID=A0AAN6DW29_9EURO|nr:fungal-specific transcription factor domain-containing protein [Exophiala viscosa]